MTVADVKSGSRKALGLVWRPRSRWRGAASKPVRDDGIVKLDYHIFKSVLNAFFGLFIGRKTRPTFFNITEAYPELDRVTRAYPAIQKEFDRLIGEWRELPQYHDVDPGERNISATTPKRWNVFMSWAFTTRRCWWSGR